MTIREAVVQRIIELCSEHGITLNKLSTKAGITQSTLNNIISKKFSNPTISTIKKICDGLDMQIVEFFDHQLFENLEQEIK